MITPRDYQEEGIKVALEFFNSKGKTKPSVFVAPVAAGKSIIIGGIAAELEDPTIVMQPSIELLNQNYNKLITFGGEASIYSASAGVKEIGHNTYATLGSIKNIAKEFKAQGVRNVMIDECHMGYSPATDSMFRKFMDALNPDRVLGFTATPIRLKQYGDMHDSWSQLNFINTGRPVYFKDILHVVPISMMVERGYWSKLKYEQYDFDEGTLKLNSSGAEYTEHSIRKAIEEQGINNNIYLRVKNLLKEGRKNILIFMDSVYNAEKMASLFENGACVSGNTKKKERQEIVEAFVNGHIQIVTNFGTLTTGFDHPQLDCIILGRPTNSLALYYQMAGRGTRIHISKENCLIIDFCNNVKRFGRLEDINFEYIEGHGWGMFSGDKLLSNVRMEKGFERTKEDLHKKAEMDAKDAINMELWFGKYKGKRVSELPSGYIKWALETWDFGDKKKKMMQKQMEDVLVAKGELVIKTKDGK
ncbi:MAG: DUF3820 family protein [Sphaerochaetaceae bacterium]|nr:DUF3820 family protein [Sphaerochaetaceae bacterium]